MRGPFSKNPCFFGRLRTQEQSASQVRQVRRPTPLGSMGVKGFCRHPPVVFASKRWIFRSVFQWLRSPLYGPSMTWSCVNGGKTSASIWTVVIHEDLITMQTIQESSWKKHNTLSCQKYFVGSLPYCLHKKWCFLKVYRWWFKNPANQLNLEKKSNDYTRFIHPGTINNINSKSCPIHLMVQWKLNTSKIIHSCTK